MSEENASTDRSEQVRQIMRDWETYKMPDDPNFARAYAGQWVAVYHGQVVAHGEKGSEVARTAPAEQYPGVALFYVPTLEQQKGVWILGTGGSSV